MQTLLVTGVYGFIASHFTNNYLNSNKKDIIIGIDKIDYCSSKHNIRHHDNKNFIFIKGDITNITLIEYIFKEYKIDIIMHFAAQSHVDNSFSNSLQYTKDNIIGTHVLLECARKFGSISKFIHVSTDEVYGESMIHIKEQKKTEQSVLCPTNPYAATKAGAELIAMSYYHSYKMPIIVTRGNNVYGPNQYPEKLIPTFICLLKNNKKLTIHGKGESIRAFIHVKDVSDAFSLILKKGKIGEIYNICNENEQSVMDIAKQLIKNIKHNDDYDKFITYVDDRLFNDKRYYVCDKKLRELGWEHKIDWKDGLQQTIKWYLDIEETEHWSSLKI